jgi:hypothetical protein
MSFDQGSMTKKINTIFMKAQNWTDETYFRLEHLTINFNKSEDSVTVVSKTKSHLQNT